MPTATWHTPSFFMTGRHSQWWSSALHLMHLWAQLHRQSLFGICSSKSGSCWMNLSSCWPITVWLQLLLRQYQLIVGCCNLFSCNGIVVLCVCWHVTIIVAITVIVIIKWHWHLDAFNGITTLIVVLGVTLGICSCVTRMTQINGSTRLVPEVLCTFRHQLCVERDVMLFFPTKANLWYKGWSLWWLWSQTWLSSCGALGFQDWWQLMSTQFVTLASEYHRFLRLAAWATWLGVAVVGALCTQKCKYILFYIHYEKG